MQRRGSSLPEKKTTQKRVSSSIFFSQPSDRVKEVCFLLLFLQIHNFIHPIIHPVPTHHPQIPSCVSSDYSNGKMKMIITMTMQHPFDEKFAFSLLSPPDVCLTTEKCNPKTEFDCDDGTCIDLSLKCNGDFNCKYRYDEDAATTCLKGSLRYKSWRHNPMRSGWGEARWSWVVHDYRGSSAWISWRMNEFLPTLSSFSLSSSLIFLCHYPSANDLTIDELTIGIVESKGGKGVLILTSDHMIIILIVFFALVIGMCASIIVSCWGKIQERRQREIEYKLRRSHETSVEQGLDRTMTVTSLDKSMGVEFAPLPNVHRNQKMMESVVMRDSLQGEEDDDNECYVPDVELEDFRKGPPGPSGLEDDSYSPPSPPPPQIISINCPLYHQHQQQQQHHHQMQLQRQDSLRSGSESPIPPPPPPPALSHLRGRVQVIWRSPPWWWLGITLLITIIDNNYHQPLWESKFSAISIIE